MNIKLPISKANNMKHVIPAFSLLLIVACQQRLRPKPVVASKIIPVKVALVEAESIAADISATGLITTANEAKLSFKTGGVIERIFVEEGQMIRKGQVLATIKPTEIDADLDQAQFAHEKAERDYNRTRNLYRDSVATLEQLQNSRTGLSIARKSVEAAAFNKQYASIIAGADGFVTKKLGNPGEIVAAGTPVLILNQTSGNKDWVLKAGVTDVDWTSISINQRSVVEVDAYPGKKFKATVLRKSQVADPSGGSFQVELKIDFGSEKPAIGMFGRATIHSGDNRQFVTVPYEAIMQADGNKGFVFIPQRDSSLKKVEVSIHAFDEQKVIIASGIDAGSSVVISNNAFLNDQSKVAVVK